MLVGRSRAPGSIAATNSTGTRCVPWWSNWKTACWASVPTPPQTIGAVARPAGAPSSADALAVQFHLELLEIGGQQPQPLVIGEDGAGLGAADVGVIAVDEGGEHGRVGVERREAEMAVHRRRAFEQALERVPAERQRGRKADRRPERIAAADASRRRAGSGSRRRRIRSPCPGAAVSAIDPAIGIGDAAPPPASRSAERALSIVSLVVKVFDAIDEQGRVRIEAGDRFLERGAVDVGDDRGLVAAGVAAERVDQQLRARAPSRRCR